MTYSRNHCVRLRRYRTLTTIVFPLVIYGFQLLSRISLLATWMTGLLVVAKALVEWGHHSPLRQCQSTTQLLPPPPIPGTIPLCISPMPPIPRMSTTMVLYPISRPLPSSACFFCHQRSPRRAYWLPTRRRVGICEQCHVSVEMSRRTA